MLQQRWELEDYQSQLNLLQKAWRQAIASPYSVRPLSSGFAKKPLKPWEKIDRLASCRMMVSDLMGLELMGFVLDYSFAVVVVVVVAAAAAAVGSAAAAEGESYLEYS